MSAPAKPAFVWAVERGVFDAWVPGLQHAVAKAGGEVVRWREGMWEREEDCPPGAVLVFQGSLESADHLWRTAPWVKGVFCDRDALSCTAWYPRFATWRLNERWHRTTVEALVVGSDVPPDFCDADGRFFVRPDSPLKPFAGRVRKLPTTWQDLDFGFYYDDPTTPIVVAPVRDVLEEWRFVVVDSRVVAGSGYRADGRTAAAAPPPEAWAYAEEVANAVAMPEPVVVLDVGLTAEGLRVVELNAFSGADLYGCDPDAVVCAVVEATARVSR